MWVYSNIKFWNFWFKGKVIYFNKICQRDLKKKFNIYIYIYILRKDQTKKNVWWFVKLPKCFDFDLFLNAKMFHWNYFSTRIDYYRWILIQLEVFIRACLSCYVKKRINNGWYVQIASCHMMEFFGKVNDVLWFEKRICDVLFLWMFRERRTNL